MALIRIIVSIRFDWSSHTSQFTVPILILTHDIFIELLIQEIRSQLIIVAREVINIATVLDLVRSESISDVYLYGYEAIDEYYFKHISDIFFTHVILIITPS